MALSGGPPGEPWRSTGIEQTASSPIITGEKAFTLRITQPGGKAMSSGFDAITERREALEDLAESDLPCADVAQALLELESEK